MKIKKRDVYWFFRSFYITSLILCLLSGLFIGMCVSWQRMQYTAFGNHDAKPIEWTEDGLRILDFII